MADLDRFTTESLPARTVYVRAPADFGIGAGLARLGVWLVEPGDDVQEGAVLAEVITPGLLLELQSPVTGKVTALRQTTGEIVEDPDAVFCELVC